MTSTNGDSAWGRLIPHLMQLQKRAALIEAEKRRAVGQGEDEQAVEAEDDEPLIALDDAVHAQLREVESALARIHAGTYGYCITCGDEIDEARLRALPTASRCVSCEREKA